MNHRPTATSTFRLVILTVFLGQGGCTKNTVIDKRRATPPQAENAEEKRVFGITEFNVAPEDAECAAKYAGFTLRDYPQIQVKNGALCRDLVADYNQLEVAFYRMEEHDVPPRCREVIKNQTSKVRGILVGSCDFKDPP